MIKEIRPSVASDCKVTGGLYDMPDRSLLGEDMVEVKLPNGILIVAGWYPEGDSSGSYRVVASEGFEQLIRRETRDIAMALSFIEEMVTVYVQKETSPR